MPSLQWALMAVTSAAKPDAEEARPAAVGKVIASVDAQPGYVVTGSQRLQESQDLAVVDRFAVENHLIAIGLVDLGR